MIEFRGLARLDITCPNCGEVYSLRVDVQDLLACFSGQSVQDVFPYAEPSVREHLITGLCDSCQREFFGE